MAKTIDLFKKMRDTKGTFHAKMGSLRWQEYTEELYKKIFITKIITMV